jgi:hypothetical protein
VEDLKEERDQLIEERDQAVHSATPLAAMAQRARVATAGGAVIYMNCGMDYERTDVSAEFLDEFGFVFRPSLQEQLQRSHWMMQNMDQSDTG